jgi:hypothetical protein
MRWQRPPEHEVPWVQRANGRADRIRTSWDVCSYQSGLRQVSASNHVGLVRLSPKFSACCPARDLLPYIACSAPKRSRCPLRRRSLAGSSGSDSQELRPTHPSKLLRSITTRPLCGSGWALAPQPGPAPQSSRWPSERDSGHHAYPNRCPRLMPSAKSQHDWPQPLRRLSNQGLSGDAA